MEGPVSKDLKVDVSNRQILSIALPITLAILIPQLNMLTNSIFLGHLSVEALGSAGITVVYYLICAVAGHGLNNAIALPRVWEYNLPARFERYAEIATLLGVDTSKMTKVQAADAAVEEAIRLSKDLGIPDNFGQLSVNSYDKNRMNTGKYEGKGDKMDTSDKQIQAISEHMMGDWGTPGNPRESTVESLIPMVTHAFTGTY